jgi:hypothetical protein
MTVSYHRRRMVEMTVFSAVAKRANRAYTPAVAFEPSEGGKR